jgi:hypothetical protein
VITRFNPKEAIARAVNGEPTPAPARPRGPRRLDYSARSRAIQEPFMAMGDRAASTSLRARLQFQTRKITANAREEGN